jgi:hypothetical protein
MNSAPDNASTLDRMAPDRTAPRRHVLRLLSGGLAFAGLALAGCADISAGPKPKRPKSYITGRGGGPGEMR